MSDELGLARRKQTVLEELYSNGRISQFIYEDLEKGLIAEIEQIEARRKELAEKMTSKLDEHQRQINILETFLANVEMSYAAGEISEELHNQEVSALNLGLEATKKELNFIKEAITQLVPIDTRAEVTAPIETVKPVEATPAETVIETVPEIATTAPIETQVETPPTEEKNIEQTVETITETPETPEASPETSPEMPIETSAEEIMPEEKIVSETLEMPQEASVEETIPKERVDSETPTLEEQSLSEENPDESTQEAEANA